MSNPHPKPNRRWRTTNAQFYGETQRRKEQDKAGGAAFAQLSAKVKREAAK